MAVVVAFVSWLAKVVNLDVVARIAQRVSSRMYTDAIRHSLQLPYAVFEDQRTGETTSAPQKLRSDVDRFVVAAVNSLFTSLVGVLFVVAYAWALGWIFATAFLLVACVIGSRQRNFEPQAKAHREVNCCANQRTRGGDGRNAAQRRTGQKPRP